ncbi:metal-binding protein [Streptomyces griseocarneus]|nr:metal-binding protein [Streptomyces griseocarneus]
MADTVREIERKYEADGRHELPDLSRVAGVASVVAQPPQELDAVYYDTEDRRLAAAGITLRRRTGGDDAGWHLKLPVAPGVRDEVRAPLSPAVPRVLADLVRCRTRRAGLAPLVRIVSRRSVHRLFDDAGALLAEASADSVTADRLAHGGRSAQWTEFEVELAEGIDPAFLDTVEKRLRKAGLRPSAAPSKLARALAETDPAPARAGAEPPKRPGGPTAGDHVLRYVREQAEALLVLDTAVRRDLPDSVHQMRVATRRMRSAFRSYGGVLDRAVTDPVGEELKWLAAELGVDRDQEVLGERLQARIAALPRTLLLGPVRRRLRTSTSARRTGSRRRTVGVLDGKRYLALLDTLDALLADPPLRPAAARPVREVLPKAVLRDYRRLAGRVTSALALQPGHERDLAMHEARKAAKRARYAAEAATPALGGAAKRFAGRMKDVQTVLGDHQDSCVAREALRALAVQAHAAGEPSFTWGLLYGQEAASAAERERELPKVWARASKRKLRERLGA